jgi:hypothetical protein
MQLGVRYSERAVQHVEGLTIDSKDRPLTTALPVQLASNIVTHSLPSSSRASRPLELVHADLSGPACVPGNGGVIYRLTITKDFTHWRWLKLITNKREETILEAFTEYKAMG